MIALKKWSSRLFREIIHWLGKLWESLLSKSDSSFLCNYPGMHRRTAHKALFTPNTPANGQVERERGRWPEDVFLDNPAKSGQIIPGFHDEDDWFDSGLISGSMEQREGGVSRTADFHL